MRTHGAPQRFSRFTTTATAERAYNDECIALAAGNGGKIMANLRVVCVEGCFEKKSTCVCYE